MLLAFVLCFSTLPMTAFAQEAAQEADVMTEQEEQIMGADCFEELFGWFNGQVAPLATGDFQLNYGTVDTCDHCLGEL